MVIKNTIVCFKNLIILECFLCINRSYLLLNNTIKTICDYLYYSIYIFVFSAATYDYIFYYTDIDFNMLVFQVIKAFEMIALSFAARYSRKIYIAVDKLDTKFGLDDDYMKILKSKADVATVAAVVSLLADVWGVMQLTVRPGLMMIFCLGSAAHDAELIFISLFINIINIRLSKSINSHPSFGCTVYRHILIASSYFNDGFQFTILLMSFVTLINTIVFGFTIVVAYMDMTVLLFGYLLWRQFKSFYLLWVVCAAAYRTDMICKQLGFHLASILVLDPRFSNDTSSKSYQTLLRWYTSVKTEKTSFKAGPDMPIGLSVPVTILDVSCNYLLLVIQFYMAYN